jgi:hypothetical protein
MFQPYKPELIKSVFTKSRDGAAVSKLYITAPLGLAKI